MILHSCVLHFVEIIENILNNLFKKYILSQSWKSLLDKTSYFLVFNGFLLLAIQFRIV